MYIGIIYYRPQHREYEVTAYVPDTEVVYLQKSVRKIVEDELVPNLTKIVRAAKWAVENGYKEE